MENKLKVYFQSAPKLDYNFNICSTPNLDLDVEVIGVKVMHVNVHNHLRLFLRNYKLIKNIKWVRATKFKL